MGYYRRVRSGELGPESWVQVQIHRTSIRPGRTTRIRIRPSRKNGSGSCLIRLLQPLISSYLLTLTYFIYSFRNITIDFRKIIDTGLQTGSGSTSYTFETRNWIRIYPLHKCTDPRLCAKHLGLQSCSLLNLILKRQISEFELIHLIFPNLISK